MDDLDEPGGTVRDIPAGTIISPAGTLIGVADTRGDVAPPAPEEGDADLAGGPTGLSDVEGEAAGLRQEPAPPGADTRVDYRERDE